MILFTEKISIPPHVLVRLLDKEAVLLNLETEVYFGLDEVGTRMWQLTTTSPDIATAYQQLVSEYDVEAETLRQHLAELLAELSEKGLVIVGSSDVGGEPAI